MNKLYLEDERPTLDQALAVIPVECLRSEEERGMLAHSFLEYWKSVGERVFHGEDIKEYAFVQFAYSARRPEDWSKDPELLKPDCANISTDLAFIPEKDIWGLAGYFEEMVRREITAIGEAEGISIQSVVIQIDEIRERRYDPFGLDPEDSQ
jgi:hypothetical protein